MRNIRTSASAVVAVGLFLPRLGFTQPDFRKASWGMTQAQVLATESGRPSDISTIKSETMVTFDSLTLGGMSGRVVYIFAKDKLVRAKFLGEAEHADENEFIADFRATESFLKEHYGKLDTDRAIWEDDSTQDETKSYLDQDRAYATGILPSDRYVGLAVALGHLKLYTSRSDARTEIWHILTGKDHNFTHQVEYRSRELEGLERIVREERTERQVQRPK